MAITRRFIGIDPGKNGALACIWEHTGRVQIYDFDGTYGSHWWPISELEDIHGKTETYVTVEDVCGRPGQSVVANTTFMKLAGQAEFIGWYLAKDGNFRKVPPQTWKKFFKITGTKEMTKTEKKKLAIELARKLFPNEADLLTASKDGRSEALLLALYGKKKYDEQISKR